MAQYKQWQFDEELQKMIDEARARGEARVRVIARELHKRVVTNPSANHRMPMACNAMWDLYHRKGGKVIHTTPGGKSTTIEIEYKTGG
jgi:hypothetical protein